MTANTTILKPADTKVTLGSRIRHQKYLLMMVMPAVVFVGIFSYMPMWGVLISFVNYNPGLGLLKSQFVGFKYFQEFLTDSMFPLLIRNSFGISALNIAFGTAFPIMFALLLNEVGVLWFKKSVQTISYLPHFISFVVVANIFLNVLSPDDGVVNSLLMGLGLIQEPVFFFSIPQLFWILVASINTWKEMGWAAIIYIAAIANIDPQLYEAAMVDGAGRWRRMWHITLKGILPTIVVLFVLSVPDLLSAGFEPSFLLGNAMVSDYSNVLETYVYTIGIQQGKYSLATAVGLMRMVVGLVLILSANAVSRRISEYSLF